MEGSKSTDMYLLDPFFIDNIASQQDTVWYAGTKRHNLLRFPIYIHYETCIDIHEVKYG